MNYQLTQTGEQVQDILNQAPTTEETLQSEITRSTNKDDALELAIGNEKTRAEGVEANLQTAIGNEKTRAEGAEANLQTAIGNEKTRAELIEGGLRTDVDGIEEKIPTGASSENKLATEGFVNSSVATNTADFKGTYNSLEALETAVPDANANDYAFVISTDAAGNTLYNRYKYVEGTGWVFEYALNNSSFTSSQWAAINSAVTAALVAKLTGLPTATELTTQLNAIIDSVATEKSRAEGIESGLRTDVNANATAIGTEKTRAEGVEGNLSTAIGNEKTRAEAAELLLQQNINAEALLRGNADTALQTGIDGINAKIPAAASSSNQLADKAFVNSSIATNTATFRGTYDSVAALDEVTADNNDYAFVVATDTAGNTVYNRYKYVEGSGWVFEYALNNSSFTATQWAAIQSGITAALVTKLSNLPTSEALTTMFAEKQNVLTFDDAPTQNSSNPVKSGGIYNAIVGINEKIPSAATDQNQLADKAWVAAQILAGIESFKGQFTTLADLEAVVDAKDGDMGIVRTTDSDGYPVFGFYQYLNDQWNVFYSLTHHNQDKPATTGSEGSFPFNGMGKVVLDKNIQEVQVDVEGQTVTIEKNLLTQDMFCKGAVGSRVPNTNTVFVIQYDFILAENVTIPANCVLEFEGGSIENNGNNALTISGNNTTFFSMPNYQVFKGDIVIKDFNIPYIDVRWFGAENITGTTNPDSSVAFQRAFNSQHYNRTIPVYVVGTYYVNQQVVVEGNLYMKGVQYPSGKGSTPSASVTYDDLNGSRINVGSSGMFWCKGAGDSTYRWGLCSVENLYFNGSDTTDSVCIKLTATGAPSRPSHIHHCYFSYFDYGVFVEEQDLGSGVNTSIQGCFDIGYNFFAFCKKPLYISSLPSENFGVCNLHLHDNVIERYESGGIHIECFGSNIIENNIIEAGVSPIYCLLKQTYSQMSIRNNYFEAVTDENHPYAMTLESYSVGTTYRIESNFDRHYPIYVKKCLIYNDKIHYDDLYEDCTIIGSNIERLKIKNISGVVLVEYNDSFLTESVISGQEVLSNYNTQDIDVKIGNYTFYRRSLLQGVTPLYNKQLIISQVIISNGDYSYLAMTNGSYSGYTTHQFFTNGKKFALFAKITPETGTGRHIFILASTDPNVDNFAGKPSFYQTIDNNKYLFEYPAYLERSQS